MAKRRSARGADEHDDGDEGGGRPTRSERREHGERSAQLARRLLSLNDADLEGLELPDAVREELEEARRIRSAAALRRHERRVAQVLRDEDLAAVAAVLDEKKRQDSEEARRFQRVEHWRDRLLTDDGAAAELRSLLPEVTAAELASLVESARRERDSGRPRGAGRALFRRLRDWLEPT